MSDSLYRTRLRWAGGKGIAMLHGVRVPLAAPPVLCGKAVAEIDYTPEVRCLEIRRTPASPMSEMTGDEIADADALLRAIAGKENATP